MVRAEASALVAAPAGRVYAFVADDFARNYRRWSPEVQHLVLLTPGPLRVGTQARQVRVDQGRRSDYRFQVTVLDPPSRVAFAEVSDLFRIDYRVTPIGQQTRLTFAFELRRLELYMRPFEKLIRMAAQDGAARVVRNIKALVEGEVAQDANGTAR
ncbi:MAG: SRPBCC family protein [Chromatiaceae bacterium]|jgi:hypothetical protein|nr:SRPBCC family protein [Chromatiaceae bacterium]